MVLIARLFVATTILYIAAGCTVPSMYQGLWANGWSTMILTTAGVYNDRGNFICSGIYGYADEPEAKTILFKDPNAFRGYIFCYYCLFVRKVNATEMQSSDFRDTICVRRSHGTPNVDYACETTKPVANKLTTWHTPTGNQESKKRGLWWI